VDFHFLVMEKSWKITVEKEGAPWTEMMMMMMMLMQGV